MKTQDTKFYIHKDRLHGQGGMVPEEEPLFILRARDINAVALLEHYKLLAKATGSDEEHMCALKIAIERFRKFAEIYPGRMKVPDTCIARIHDGKISI